MPSISFFVEGRPYAKQSFRFTKGGYSYQTSNVKNWQRTVSICAKEVYRGDLLNEDVTVGLDFVYSGAGADLDNFCKAVIDGLQGSIFVNDRKVVGLFATKRKHQGSETLGVQIRIDYGNI